MLIGMLLFLVKLDFLFYFFYNFIVKDDLNRDCDFVDFFWILVPFLNWLVVHYFHPGSWSSYALLESQPQRINLQALLTKN